MPLFATLSFGQAKKESCVNKFVSCSVTQPLIMLRQSAFVALTLGLGLTTASPANFPASIFRRNNIDICVDTSLASVPVPDHSNFQLPLEGLRQDMCWGFCIGDQLSCPVQSKICFDFVGYTLTFD